MGKELINWENGRWIGHTLEVENAFALSRPRLKAGLSIMTR